MYALWWVIIGSIAGWAMGKLLRGSGYIPLMDIVIGIAGALVTGGAMRAIGSKAQGGNHLVAAGGALVLTLLYELFVRGVEIALDGHSVDIPSERRNRSLRKAI